MKKVKCINENKTVNDFASLDILASIKKKYIDLISQTKFPRFTKYEQLQFSAIEDELKELIEYRKCIDLKEAEYVSTHKVTVVETDIYNVLVKNSQAIEIIKNKRVNIDTLMSTNTVEDYNILMFVISHNCQLTKKEYILLKETFKNE